MSDQTKTIHEDERLLSGKQDKNLRRFGVDPMFHEVDSRREATDSLEMMEEGEQEQEEKELEIEEVHLETLQNLKDEDAEKQPPTGVMSGSPASSRQQPPHRAPDSAEVSRSQMSVDGVPPELLALYEKYSSITRRTANIKTLGSLDRSKPQEDQATNDADQGARP